MLSNPPGKSLKVLAFTVELPTAHCKASKDKVCPRGPCPLKCIGVQSIWAV